MVTEALTYVKHNVGERIVIAEQPVLFFWISRYFEHDPSDYALVMSARQWLFEAECPSWRSS